MKQPLTIIYLRSGRKVRASGTVLDINNGLTKVKPDRADWGAVWLTQDELKAGSVKPPMIPRQKPATDEKKPKRTRTPKTPPLPRWKQLVDRVRVYEADHVPSGWPAVEMRFLTELADEIEAAQTLFKTQP